MFIKPIAMHEILGFSTSGHNGLYDVTDRVKTVVRKSGIREGLVSVYAQGATAAIMIQENWDESVQHDVVTLLNRIVPEGQWEHDALDSNGDAHLKAGIVGPSETIPLIDGELALSTWQNIFFCEFDGPRSNRHVVVTVIPG